MVLLIVISASQKHLQEDVNASYLGNERFGRLIRATALAGIHPGKEFIQLCEELKGEEELPTPHQAFIL